MKKLLVLLLAAAMLCGLTAVSLGEEEVKTATEVWASAESPTGYFVTFRLPDADYGRVRIYGEWCFTDLHRVSRVSGSDPDPWHWKPGDFVCCNGAGWPTAEMTLNENGVWEYTIPLPCGSWDYRFILGGDPDTAVADTAGATLSWDPSNVPFHAALKDMSEYTSGDDHMSTIYVPFDPEKQIDDFSIEAPRDGENGTLSFVQVNEELAPLQVYLPYGYDAEREQGYKVVYLAANMATNTWFGLGVAGNILDNAIAEGLMEPVVAVCSPYSSYDAIVNTYVPYILENYNVSGDPQDWAITAYSASGVFPTTAIFDPDHFGWCAPMSTYANQGMIPEGADFADPILKDKHILYVQAMFETYWGQMLDEHPALLIGLHDNGIEFATCWPLGTHAWSVWRQGLTYMCTEWLWK